MLNNFFTKEVKFSLSTENYLSLNKLIKEENPDSILASLNKNLIKKYLEISIKSDNLFFYICEYENKIIGYAILARQPLFLINEFNDIKYSIFFNLLLNFKLKTIINILLSMSKIDLFFINKENKDIINKTFNLNLLAIDRKFQSKGIGKAFVRNIFEDLKKNNNLEIITVETFNKRAQSFYENKLNFHYIGKKLRFFKNLIVYKKSLL
tara:strand:- start:402 stop:1028 length:627 start_codon:yes stop_codon:yes gene_type:complete